jgi:hypothetical protein
MVGSMFHASEVSLLLLVPTSNHPVQIKCAKNSLRYLIRSEAEVFAVSLKPTSEEKTLRRIEGPKASGETLSTKGTASASAVRLPVNI